ncbi:MAG: TonB-dependent receptor [Candidatus Omnitrophota bacterium]
MRVKKILAVTLSFVLLAGNVWTDDGLKAGKDKIVETIKDVVTALTDPLEKVVTPLLELGQIVVTPTKTKEKLGAQSSSVTVIGEGAIDKQRYRTVKDALKGEMGIDAPSLGSFTGQTSIFMRGTNANHTAVMVDGLHVYDPISTNGAFNLAHLTLDNVERIEIVRGAQSSLYGSDAIGGVINIITKKTEVPFFKAGFEAGSFSTFKEDFSFGSKAHGLHYSVGGSNIKSRGISQAQAKRNNPERDGFERYALSARVDYDLFEDCTIGGTFRHTRTLFDYDEFGRDDSNIYQKDYQTLFTQYVDHKPFDFYSYFIKFGWMHSFRRDYDENDEGSGIDYLRDWYKGEMFKFDYRNNIHLFEMDTVTIGYEYTDELGDFYRFQAGSWGTSTSDMPKVFSRNSALYLQNRLNMRDRLTATQGMRIDRHSTAGDHVTYKLDGSYLFPTGTKARGGWATGFKAPTLYQLNAVPVPAQWGWFGFGGGNPNLEPETSQSYEMGLDQYMFGEKVLLNVTYFHTMLYSVIGTTVDAMWNVSRFLNLGKAHSHGLECGGRFKPTDYFEVKGSYTYNPTYDFSTDRPLLRRPLHKFKVNTYLTIMPKWDVNVEVLYSGIRHEVNIDKLKPYIVANLNTNYKITDNFDIFLKIVNMFDQGYEELRGYGTSPLAFYVGTKTEF